MSRELLFAALCNGAPPMPESYVAAGQLAELLPAKELGTAQVLQLWADAGGPGARKPYPEDTPARTQMYVVADWYQQQRAERAAYNAACREAAMPTWRVLYANQVIAAAEAVGVVTCV